MVTKLKELEKLTEKQQKEIQKEMERGFTELEYTYPKGRIKLRKPQRVWAHFILVLTGGIGNVIYAVLNESESLKWSLDKKIRSTMTPHQMFLGVIGVLSGLFIFLFLLSILSALA